MFVDYYAILEVEKSASIQEIKSAFRKQSLKWHPDKNLGINTTENMQNINEAYLILKDLEARRKYDVEWEFYNEFEKSQKHSEETVSENKKTKEGEEYKFHDEILEKWMYNAKKQSVNLAQQSIKDLKNIAKEGAKGSMEYVIYSIIFMIINFIVFKTCNN